MIVYTMLHVVRSHQLKLSVHCTEFLGSLECKVVDLCFWEMIFMSRKLIIFEYMHVYIIFNVEIHKL